MQDTFKAPCLLLILFSSWITFAAVEEKHIDYLSLAGRLVHDGDYSRAEEILKKVSEEEKNSEKYLLASSLLHLYQERFNQALVGFENLLHTGSNDRYIFIYLGQSYFGLKRYQETLDSFEKVKDLADSISSIQLIKCRSLWALEDWDKAWKNLNQAITNNQGDFRFLKLKTNWLLSKNLKRQAYLFTLQQLKNPDVKLNDKITLASGLRNQNLTRESIKVLEVMRLKNPSSIIPTVQLAYSYLKDKQFLNAAQLFQEASLRDTKYTFEAAELYRRAGWYQTALLLNRQVDDQKKKFQQRLAILISQGEYEQAAATEADLLRLGLLDSEEVRYALAFAFFKSRQYKKVDTHLSFITKTDLFKKAIALRKEMAKCQSNSSCV